MARRRKGRPVHGWLILDKPLGMTSTQAVAKVRWLFNAQKAGHGGTLDPLASGLLPIALGEATKTVPFVMDGRKSYRFTVRWGIATTTDDGEGEVTNTSDHRPEQGEVENILPQFIGEIMQVPPVFSALKVDGERAYDLARAGVKLEMQPRSARIDDLRLIECPDANHAVFEADCGKGTYIRALGRDLAVALGSFGHIVALRRTRSGAFTEGQMILLEKLMHLRHKDAVDCVCIDAASSYLLGIETALDDIPALAIDAEATTRVRRGQPVLMSGRDAPVNLAPVLVTSQGQPIALGEVENGMLKPKRVFNL